MKMGKGCLENLILFARFELGPLFSNAELQMSLNMSSGRCCPRLVNNVSMTTAKCFLEHLEQIRLLLSE